MDPAFGLYILLAGTLIVLAMIVRAGLAYLAARYLLELELIPSLFVTVALTATSVGISAAIWREKNRIDDPVGQLMLDVAEMDDITGVLLMALLFALAPVLRSPGGADLLELVTGTLVEFGFRFGGFVAFCLVFPHYLEKPLTDFFSESA